MYATNCPQYFESVEHQEWHMACKNLDIAISEVSKETLMGLNPTVLTVFTEAKDGGGGDNWTTGAISRAKLQSHHHHLQTNTQLFYRPDAHPVAQPTVSKH